MKKETDLNLQKKSPTCSMTSGAIQHGVPTNVLRTLFLVMSPPAARKALTPKSGFGMLNTNITLTFVSILGCANVQHKIMQELTVNGWSLYGRTWLNSRFKKKYTLYQQFALSRLHQEECFQLWDPCVWRESEREREFDKTGITVHQARSSLHTWALKVNTHSLL